MGHGAEIRTPATARERLEAVGAADVAAALQALATPSRLRILARLQEGPCAATELADAVGMEQSACSHQLRLLRNLDLVTAERRAARSSTPSTTTMSPNSSSRPCTTWSTCAWACGTPRPSPEALGPRADGPCARHGGAVRKPPHLLE